MNAAISALKILGAINEGILRIGRAIGVVAVALMVVAILIQVFFRYVLNNALPWPDEAARFCMLWMTGLMAPTAFRTGGFVAIDMLVRPISMAATQPKPFWVRPCAPIQACATVWKS